MIFEWDERKAARNIAKHGVPFEYAARVFWIRFASTPKTLVALMVKNGDSRSAGLMTGFMRSLTPCVQRVCG
jgi:uncharacterized DUF497 family protein